jgi:tetratricopeptide (TPR) repeat protein
VPLPTPAGVAQAYTYPQVRLLASTQGVAIQPLADGIRVRVGPDGIAIDALTGLAVSPPDTPPGGGASTPPASDPAPSPEPAGRLLNERDWQGGSGFVARRRALERAVVDAVPEAREAHRLRLAQFLLGQGFAAEALGALTVTADGRPGLATEPPFLLLRGAARLLAGHNGPARDDLARAHAASGAAEAKLWAAAARTAAGEPAGELGALPEWTTIALAYPPPLRLPLTVRLAEAAIAGGRLDDAHRLLDAARSDARSDEAKAEIAYLEGLRMQAAGDPVGALASWEEAAKGGARRGRVQAELARTLLLVRQGTLPPADAIAALDRLRVVWRGDELEFRVLRELGRLQLQAGDYPAALRTLRLAAGDFPAMPEAAQATREMAQAFERLYLDGAADALPPVTALALWEEFSELTPPGEKGALMIRRLAERLVQVDLLERAASLLDGLLATAADATDRARLGARIAEIRLADGKPQEGAEALRRTAAPGLPPDLQQRRSRIQARALLALGRTNDALAALGTDGGLEAELLRAQAARARGDWAGAAAALRRVVDAGRTGSPAELDERQARDILELAVALTLAGSDPQLAQLDDDFREAMAPTPLRDAFRLIAGTVPPPGADPAALAELVEKAMAFRRTLAPAAGAAAPR